ncbi:MAG: GDSL-type esterase/lipase family protein [Bacillota bacterium]
MNSFRVRSSPRRRGLAALSLLLILTLWMGIAEAENVSAAVCADVTDPSPAARQGLPETLGRYNPLFGKTLVAAGDSLTAGYSIAPDPETGIIPTYPVVAGCRNRMNVENLAINGAWMTSGRYSGSDVEGFSSYFDDEGFLPAEMDYFTINLGANDWSYGVLGLMDDYCLLHFAATYYNATAEQQTQAESAEDWIAKFVGSESDTGISTWLGAWNTVLTYLRTNYPQTKIGILVSYPCQDVEGAFAARLRETLFQIADKYGYPTLDCGDPDQWFCVGYAEGLDPDIGNLIADVYTLDRCHPNALGHEMTADSYEAWLKGL